MVPLPEGFSDRLKANLYGVIMTSLQREIKWFHEGLRFVSDKILIYILVKENVLYTGKSPHEVPLIQRDTENAPYQLFSVCSLVNLPG